MTATRQTPGAKQERAITPYRIVASVLLAAAVVGVGWAFSEHRETDDISVIDTAVAYVEPAPGETALRQDRIFVRLQENFTGVLFVNRVEIPEDQLDRSEGVNTMSYTPTRESETGELPGGRVEVWVEYWDINETRADSRTSPAWTYNVS